MKKALAYGLAVGFFAAASIVAAAPAHAAATATMSPTSDVYPGQDITLTLVDDGTFCQSSVTGNGTFWGAFARVYDSTNTDVGSIGFYPSESYTAAAHTYTMTGTADWLVDSSTPATAGDFTTGQLQCEDPGGYVGSVDANTLAFSMKPITVSASSVEQGGSFDVTVSDSTNTWCEGGTGAGYSMGIGLQDANGNMSYIPAGLSAGSGVKGSGDFNWQGTTTTVNVTVPADFPVGTYTLFAGCVSPEADGFQQPGPGMTLLNFEITAAKLPDTGLSVATMGTTGLAGLALLVVGAVAVIARRRSVSAR